MMTAGGPTAKERLTYGFRAATARPPRDTELAVLTNVFQKQLDHFGQNKDAAIKLLSVGESKRNEALDPVEHAAYTMAANLILNLDETITKE